MRIKLFKLVWILLPVGFLALHYGPGKDYLARDRAGGHLKAGMAAVGSEAWGKAASLFNAARMELPGEDEDKGLRLALEEAVSRIRSGDIVEGQEQLQELLDILEEEPGKHGELERSVRSELAMASYYAGWIMRLEGAIADEWKPEVERARQLFRYLAEEAEDEGNEELLLTFKKNLENAIRLEQMDLTELLARPLPKNCPNCENLSQRKRKQCQSRCKGKGKGKGEGDKKTRKEIKESNSAGINKRKGTGS